jgi:hypothetical protein
MISLGDLSGGTHPARARAGAGGGAGPPGPPPPPGRRPPFASVENASARRPPRARPAPTAGRAPAVAPPTPFAFCGECAASPRRARARLASAGARGPPARGLLAPLRIGERGPSRGHVEGRRGLGATTKRAAGAHFACGGTRAAFARPFPARAHHHARARACACGRRALRRLFPGRGDDDTQCCCGCRANVSCLDLPRRPGPRRPGALIIFCPCFPAAAERTPRTVCARPDLPSLCAPTPPTSAPLAGCQDAPPPTRGPFLAPLTAPAHSPSNHSASRSLTPRHIALIRCSAFPPPAAAKPGAPHPRRAAPTPAARPLRAARGLRTATRGTARSPPGA